MWMPQNEYDEPRQLEINSDDEYAVKELNENEPHEADVRSCDGRDVVDMFGRWLAMTELFAFTMHF